MIRVGQGYDVHQLVEGRPLIIGESRFLLKKACLATLMRMCFCMPLRTRCSVFAGEGDIGKHFPDTDEAFKDADSKNFFRSHGRL